jgi:hypothetical protein
MLPSSGGQSKESKKDSLASRDGATILLWGQDAGSEVGITRTDEIHGDGDALVEGFSAEAVRVDYVAEFVLWVTLWRGWDSFI